MAMPVRTGSTRIMRPVEPGVIALQYTNRWSAFDRGSSPQEIPKIGAARCACAVHSFELAEKADLPTHFIEQVDPVTIHAWEFMVPHHDLLSGAAHGIVLPAEWIWRRNVLGSLFERLKQKKIKPSELGFAEDAEIVEGMKLPHMLLECTTKFESVDRHLTDVEAMKLVNLDQEQFDAARQLVLDSVDVTCGEYERVGFSSPDGKDELGITTNGRIVLVDVFGTQDENRILRGTEIFSKDLIRNYLKSLPWKKKLDEAKELYPNDKSRWPEYPVLPGQLVELVSARYAQVALDYAGVRV